MSEIPRYYSQYAVDAQTDKIQVFESREEYDEVIKFIWKLMKGDNDT